LSSELGPVEAALERRRALVDRLLAEGTDCYRLFHGIAEGRPGLAIDRYGPILLVTTWRDPLEGGDLEGIHEVLGAELAIVWNHRAKPRRVPFARFHDPEIAGAPEGREFGLRYDVTPRHRGLDALLFLDFRCGRRRLLARSRGKSVLNLFAYTCGSGLAAAAGGAREVWNVDFSASSLEIGRGNFVRNGLYEDGVKLVSEDAIAVSRQLAGLQVAAFRGRGPARRSRSFTRFEPRAFDVVVLDPPRWSKGPFGAVDVVRDYPALFKPALLATAEGGSVLATNHAPEVSRDEFLRVLERTARKCGRPIRNLEWLPPEEDFPSFDESPPLKAAWIEV
jgi:23S rRNA (cytosine1962-C5)-methyltransferase